MNLKQLKKILNSNPDSFQILKTDSPYLISVLNFELIELDSISGIYKRIAKISFNQFMKLNLEKIKTIASGSSLLKCHLYKFIKE